MGIQEVKCQDTRASLRMDALQTPWKRMNAQGIQYGDTPEAGSLGLLHTLTNGVFPEERTLSLQGHRALCSSVPCFLLSYS